MARLVIHASTDWQVFVNKNGGMWKSLMNFTKNYKVFWRARALKIQIFKKLKRIFCASCYKNKLTKNWLFCILEHHIHEGMFNLKNLKVYFLTEVFDFRYNISFIDPPLRVYK